MSKFKTGDRVLVEATIEGQRWIGSVRGYQFRTQDASDLLCDEDQFHPMPPVSYEALMEELELRDDPPAIFGVRETDKQKWRRERMVELRSQRLAAMNPGPKEGDEVWVRAKVAATDTIDPRICVEGVAGGGTILVERDDIKIIKGERNE